MIHTETRHITPEVAQVFLSNNPTNRSVNPVHVDFLSRQMQAHEWKTNGETIKIGEDGSLIDGQHRLSAIVKAGFPVEMMIVSGIPVDARATIDTGRRRTSADTLRMNTYSNAVVLAACVRLTLVWKRAGLKISTSYQPSNGEILAYVQAHPEIEAAVTIGASYKGLGPPSVASFLSWAAGSVDSAARDEFFNIMRTGFAPSPNAPAFVLRERMIKHATGVSLLTPLQVLQLYVKAWNHHVAGRSIRIIRVQDNEQVDFEITPSI